MFWWLTHGVVLSFGVRTVVAKCDMRRFPIKAKVVGRASYIFTLKFVAGYICSTFMKKVTKKT